MSGLAIASLVFSLLSLVFSALGFIPGIVCGHLARARMRSDPWLKGEGLAIAGLILGYFSAGLTLAVLAILLCFPPSSKAIAQFWATLTSDRETPTAARQTARAARPGAARQRPGGLGPAMRARPGLTGTKTTELTGVSIGDAVDSGGLRGAVGTLPGDQEPRSYAVSGQTHYLPAWRRVDGMSYNVSLYAEWVVNGRKGANPLPRWAAIAGRVIESHQDGVVIQGAHLPPPAPGGNEPGLAERSAGQMEMDMALRYGLDIGSAVSGPARPRKPRNSHGLYYTPYGLEASLLQGRQLALRPKAVDQGPMFVRHYSGNGWKSLAYLGSWLGDETGATPAMSVGSIEWRGRSIPAWDCGVPVP